MREKCCHRTMKIYILSVYRNEYGSWEHIAKILLSNEFRGGGSLTVCYLILNLALGHM